MCENTKSDFETRVLAFMMFIEKMGARHAAELYVNQDKAMEGLQKNNRSLAKAYREALSSLPTSNAQETATPCAVCGEEADGPFYCPEHK